MIKPRHWNSDRLKVGKSFPRNKDGTLKTRTKQQFRDECDINVIMKKYRRTGVLPPNLKTPLYGDFTTVPSYEEALAVVIKADEQFGSLPASVRDRFANNPTKFLEFAQDPRNGEEMVRLGLATKRPVQPNVDNVEPPVKAKPTKKTPKESVEE